MESFEKGPVIFTSGETQFYGCFESSGVLYVLDDALTLNKSTDGPLYSVLTVFKRGDGPVTVELARLYRASELKGGAMPYHAKQEVLWSDRVEEKRLSDISSEIRCVTLETRRAFIARSDFPATAFFYHSPEVYWAGTENSSVLPRQIDRRPTETKTSVFRRMLPDHAVIRARAMKRAPIDEDISLTGSNGSHTTAGETDSGATKHDIDLTQEESQLTIDIGKSNDGIEHTNRKRLRRLASMNEGIRNGDSLEFGTPEGSLAPFGDDSPIQLDEDTNDIEPIETPPSIAIKKTPMMWTLEAEDGDDSPKKDLPRDKDDWINKQSLKADGSKPKTPRKESVLVRPTPTQPDQHDLSRTTQLAKANTHLNNYTAYATDDGQGTTRDPPKPTNNIRSYFATPSPTKPNSKTKSLTSGITSLDSDGEEDNDFTKQHLTSSPSSSAEPKALLPTKTWRPTGPKQTTISFAKAPKNALDSAVLTTGSLKGSSAAPSTPESKPSSRISTSTASSSSKKKSIMPLMVAGIAASDATPSKLRGGKSSPTKSKDPKNKKRLREGDDISDDEEGNETFFSSLGLRKLRKLSDGSPSKVQDPIQSEYRSKANKSDDEDEEGVAAEMEGFIVDDDEEIEYDNKIRFVDEEPTNTDLKGYMDLDQPSAVGSHSSIDFETAIMRYFQYLISSVINPSFASTYAGDRSQRDAYFSPAIQKIRSKVDSIKDGLIASSVWSSDLQTVIDMYPNSRSIPEKTSGGIELVCQVCRRKHTCPKIVQLSGVPYDCEAFWNGRWIDNPAEDEEESLKSIRAGQTCSGRVLAYHQLQHLQYHLVQQIRPKVEKARVEIEEGTIDDDIEIQLLDHLLKQTTWLHELKLRIERLFEAALDFGLKVSSRTEVHDDFTLNLQYE